VVSIWLTGPVDDWNDATVVAATPTTTTRLNEIWKSVQYNNVGSKKQNDGDDDGNDDDGNDDDVASGGEDDTLNAQLLLLNR